MKKLLIILIATITFTACGKEYTAIPTPDLSGYTSINLQEWYKAGAPLDTTFYVNAGVNGPYVHVSNSMVSAYTLPYDFQQAEKYSKQMLYVPDSIYIKYISQ